MEHFTIAVYSYSGESELPELACGTIYANKTDMEKENDSWEATRRKKRGDSSSCSKVLPERLPPCSRPCFATFVWHRLLLCLDICVVCRNCQAKDRSVSMHRFPRGPNHEINCCFFHEGTGLIP